MPTLPPPRPPPPEQPVLFSMWRTTQQDEETCRTIEADLMAHYAPDNLYIRYLAAAIKRVRLARHQAALWEVAWAWHPNCAEPASLTSQVRCLAIAFEDLEVGFEHAEDEIKAYEDKRRLKQGERPQDHDGRLDAKGRPIRKAAKPVRHHSRTRFILRRAYAHFAKRRCVSVHLPALPYRGPRTENRIDWYLGSDLHEGVRSHVPGDAGFEHAHYVGLNPEDLVEARCSWVQRYKGRPCLLLPDGRRVWLGPHYKAIEGTRNQRLKAATPATPDPLLWPLDETTPTDSQCPMTQIQALTRLRRATGLPDIKRDGAVRTGRADLAARGATAEYLAHASGVTSETGYEGMQDFVDRVLLAQADGVPLGIGPAKQAGSAPGTLTCEVCDHAVLLTDALCASCLAPTGEQLEDPNHQKRWELHRIIDDILDSRGERDSDREDQAKQEEEGAQDDE